MEFFHTAFSRRIFLFFYSLIFIASIFNDWAIFESKPDILPLNMLRFDVKKDQMQIKTKQTTKAKSIQKKRSIFYSTMDSKSSKLSEISCFWIIGLSNERRKVERNWKEYYMQQCALTEMCINPFSMVQYKMEIKHSSTERKLNYLFHFANATRQANVPNEIWRNETVYKSIVI